METHEEKGTLVIDQAQINAWKAKYKNVFLIEVEDKKAYLKAPGRNELSYATTVAKQDPIKFNSAILDKCWLAGDEEIKTDDRLFMGVAEKLDQLVETAEATIKKL